MVHTEYRPTLPEVVTIVTGLTDRASQTARTMKGMIARQVNNTKGTFLLESENCKYKAKINTTVI
jgi:hypothetical protein